MSEAHEDQLAEQASSADTRVHVVGLMISQQRSARLNTETPPITCLNCHSEMLELTEGEILYDRCSQCGSHWFDRDELLTLINAPELELSSEGLARRLQLPQRCRWCDTLYPPGTTACEPCGRPIEHPCPRDQQLMYVVPVLGIEIDVCATCGGVWFDGQELEQLRRATGPVESGLAQASGEFEGAPLAHRWPDEAPPAQPGTRPEVVKGMDPETQRKINAYTKSWDESEGSLLNRLFGNGRGVKELASILTERIHHPYF